MTATANAVRPPMSARAEYGNYLARREHLLLRADRTPTLESEKISFVALCLNAEQAHFTPALRTEQQGFQSFGLC